jgi:hypothetical protein
MNCRARLYNVLRSVLLVAAAAAAPLACSDDAAPAEGDSDDTGTIIGADGGEASGDGATVTVPAGALADDIEIGVEEVMASALSATLPASTTLSGPIIAFTPHGTEFSEPATIELPYVGAANTVLRLDNESDTTWEVVAGAVFTGGIASFESTTFSLYAAAQEGEACTAAPGTYPTGTTTVSGAGFTAVDAVARMVEMTDVGTEGGTNPFRTELQIYVTSYANACALEENGNLPMGSEVVRFVIMRNGSSDYPGLPPAATYSYDTTLPMANDGTTYFRGGAALDDCMMNCEWCSMLGGTAPSGSITLTSVSSSVVEGSVNFTDATGATYTGNFNAPVCGSNDPNPSYCCFAPSAG